MWLSPLHLYTSVNSINISNLGWDYTLYVRYQKLIDTYSTIYKLVISLPRLVLIKYIWPIAS